MGNPRLFLPLAVLLFLALILPQTVGLDFYHDEVVELSLYRGSPIDFVRYMYAGHLVRPPLFGLVQHVWMAWFGDSLWALRSLSTLFSVACIPLLFVTARKVYDEATARAAVLIYVLSPFVLLWGRVAGWYPMMMCWVLAAQWTYLELGRGWKYSIGYAVSILFALYTNYYAVAVPIAHAVHAVWYRRDRLRPGGERPVSPPTAPPRRGMIPPPPQGGGMTRHGLRLVAGILALDLLLFLPWVPAVLRQFRHLEAIRNLPQTLGGLKTVAYTVYSFALGETLLPGHSILLVLFGAGLLPVAWGVCNRKGRPMLFLFGSQIVWVLVAGLVTGSLAPYRAYPFFSLFALVMASGVSAVLRRPGIIPFSVLLLAPAWLLSIANFQRGHEFLKIGMLAPWKEVHARLGRETAEGDVVIHGSDVLLHHLGREPIAATVIPIRRRSIGPTQAGGKVFVIEDFSSYEPQRAEAFSEVLGILEACCRRIRREILLKDPDWREKAKWAGEWSFREEKILLHEFEVRRPLAAAEPHGS